MTNEETSEEKVDEEHGTVTLVYAGKRIGLKNKYFHTFYRVNDDGTRDTASRYYAKINGLGRPGGVYEFDYARDSERTLYPGTMRYVRHWANEGKAEEEDVLQWQLRHTAIHVAERARRRGKKETNRDLLRDQLQPIRDVYIESAGWERKAILAEVVAYIVEERR